MSLQELYIKSHNSQDQTLAMALDQTILSSSQSQYMKVEVKEDEVDTSARFEGLSHTFGPSVFDHPKVDDISNSQRFEVVNLLGRGAFGEVYSAQDYDLNRQVALKQFKGEPAQAIQACRNEVRFVGRLEHPGIPPVYQVSVTEEGAPYIVMKQLEGEPLSDLIDRLRAGDTKAHAQYSFRARVMLIIQLLRVVESAHESRILHRDIKPDNIYISNRGELYLIDWGISEDLKTAKEQPGLCGTPLYMSPEQGKAQPLDIRSDLFSVGAVAYELLSLQSCAPQDTSLAEFINILPKFIPQPVDLNYHESQGYSPSEFKMPIMKAIQRSPANRYQSAAEMRYDLEQSLDGHFDILCPRTLIKSATYRLSTWLDKRLNNILIVYASLFTVLILLLCVGGLIGRLLF